MKLKVNNNQPVTLISINQLPLIIQILKDVGYEITNEYEERDIIHLEIANAD